ncbi:MAG TPA: hypothetical protein PL118_07085 [Rectinema sp.]|nr:hypothetical protein [Rectinema sp.]
MRKILLVFAIMLAVFLVGCPNAPSNDVQEVEEYQASNLKASGATNVPEDEQGIIDVFASAENMENDPFVTDLAQFFESFNNGSGEDDEEVENTDEGVESIAKRALSAAKDLAESLNAEIDEIIAAINNFPNTKSLDEEIDVTGEYIGTYLTFTKGEATLGASAETTDDAAIAEDLSNLKKISGEASLDIEVNPTNELYSEESAIKDLKFRMKAAGNVKAVANEDPARAPTITLNYRESLSIGLSFCNSGKGGKFVIKEDADYSRTFTGEEFYEATNAENSDELIDLLEPNITISLKVYDDNNIVRLSRAYDTIDDFIVAFNPEGEPQ